MARLPVVVTMLSALVLPVGCIPDIGEGHFACTDERGCPDGWFCHSDGRCYSWEPAGETTWETCSNGHDDDDDGVADCLDSSCVEGGFCEDRPAECNPVMQTGCPVGMGCYADIVGGELGQLWCRMPGTAVQGDPCALSSECAAGHGCEYTNERGVCARYCAEDHMCMTGALCRRAAVDPIGVCSTPCDPTDPVDSCAEDFTCVPFSLTQEAGFAMGGAYHWCSSAEDIRAASAGAGDVCLDPAPLSTDAEQVCGIGTLCVPDGVCRETCLVEESSPCTEPAESCVAPAGPLYDANPVSTYFGASIGVCTP